MSNPAFAPVFSVEAAEFLLQFSKRRQRRLISLARQLANHPHVRSDYTLADESGRPIEYLAVDEYIFAYWLDHRSSELRIVDIEDAS